MNPDCAELTAATTIEWVAPAEKKVDAPSAYPAGISLASGIHRASAARSRSTLDGTLSTPASAPGPPMSLDACQPGFEELVPITVFAVCHFRRTIVSPRKISCADFGGTSM